MSSRGTIFLTEDNNEHCYEETNEQDGGQFRIYLEIDMDSVTFFEKDENDMIIGIKGDCELAKYLRKAKG